VELRHLRYFIAVADVLHFGRAAKRLHISQPPLSRQIQALEEELGVALFHRTRRAVRLTEPGLKFLEEARRTLLQADRSVEVARRAGRGELGKLEIGFAPMSDMAILPKVLGAFRQRTPDVEIRLHYLNTPEQLQALREGTIDVGLLRMPADAEGIVVETILREPIVLVMPKGHRLGKRAAVPIKALADEPYVIFPRHYAPRFYDFILGIYREAGVGIQIAIEAVSIHNNLNLVAGGMGVSLLPESVGELRRSGVISRPLVGASPQVETGIAHRRPDRGKALAAFLSVVKELYPSIPGPSRPPRARTSFPPPP
jgi:DNA-binding transcriptional LysR family regulator